MRGRSIVLTSIAALFIVVVFIFYSWMYQATTYLSDGKASLDQAKFRHFRSEIQYLFFFPLFIMEKRGAGCNLMPIIGSEVADLKGH